MFVKPTRSGSHTYAQLVESLSDAVACQAAKLIVDHAIGIRKAAATIAFDLIMALLIVHTAKFIFNYC